MSELEIDLEVVLNKVLAGKNGRVITIRHSPFLLAAVNNNGKPALLARTSLDVSQVVNDGRGFTVQTRRSSQDDFVQITSSDVTVTSMFLKLISFVLEKVGSCTNESDGAKALILSIDEFRSFTDTRRGRISESLVRGTFAELLLLRTLVTYGMSPSEALSSWKGPFAREGLGLHDFTFDDGSGIEVKSKSYSATSIRVSSVNQLVPSNSRLDLVVLPIEVDFRGSSRSIGFRDFAIETGTLFPASGTTSSSLWDDALDALGLDLSDEWYDRFRFIVGDWNHYHVRDGFPFLDIPHVNRGIVDIRYSLDLGSLRAFEGNFSRLMSEIGESYIEN